MRSWSAAFILLLQDDRSLFKNIFRVRFVHLKVGDEMILIILVKRDVLLVHLLGFWSVSIRLEMQAQVRDDWHLIHGTLAVLTFRE